MWGGGMCRRAHRRTRAELAACEWLPANADTDNVSINWERKGFYHSFVERYTLAAL